ncbi:class 1b ribonucleoside-diphosphate reductase subunit alpha [Paenibacillus chitinolyticus]|uniref:Ribonucleoside-diphosphate reductase n=1 Tax=Paenibacillus chitinolyticus TaxID=79263 RepID=A0A410WUB3_9BACL|nr:class 1b ribonucleoside-diphosphate reductase subunit alpha [Paenibacillus chitinolyticus]MCY9593030.1 class 1b ribonucleoside-diphosphate reductase subunit alpha [Paenibacillus chitinolyticus]MCY9595206.1 class 1b ribonucleoside-diphosphate reductase subunit alpha [Paenibacillus chitinolyticus]QAV18066.1 class 1b ribonucleoside-diphosphate reductase subunit alpha [Paenibacillus chitinolyticus]
MKSYLKLNNEVLNQYSRTGKLDLAKDKEATRRYFLEHVNAKLRYFIDTREKIRYLVDEGYYESEFLEQYDMSFIERLYEKAYAYEFRFPSFMSASKFYESYAMKSRNGEEILEKYEDRIVITALYLAQGDEHLAERAVEVMMSAYQPATPTALNSGKKARGELVSCFKLTMDDSMNSISENIGYCLELSRLGGGVGVNVTDLRPLGDPIKGILNRASGVMPVAKLLENSFSYSNQLGQRNGSGVIYLNIFHADIENFISAKKPNADDKIRLATLSTGIIVPSIFFELMKRDKDVVLFSPYDIYKEYGKRMSEISISEMYYELLDNPNVRKIKRINARKLYTEVKKAQFESGYPFEVFDDQVNEKHPLRNLGRVKMSNLCTEILQVQSTSIINDHDKENEYGLDVSCNLGSLDIHKAVQEDDFEQLIDTSMRLLTDVSMMTEIKNVPSVAKANRLMHSIGLGLMNLHGHLVSQGILYGSKESVQFIDAFMEAVNYYSLLASMRISQEKKATFHGFEQSDYANGSYFEQYVSKEVTELPEQVRKALGNVPVITQEMWRSLKEQVMEHGLFNAYRLAIAPTGSISYIRSSTASIAPCTEKVEIRDYADSRTIYPMPFLNNDNISLYKEAYEIDQYRMIDLYAAAQRHIDQGISMTLYVTDQWTTEQLARLYIYAWMKGIKTVYYVRQRLQTIEECVSCSI